MTTQAERKSERSTVQSEINISKSTEIVSPPSSTLKSESKSTLPLTLALKAAPAPVPAIATETETEQQPEPSPSPSPLPASTDPVTEQDLSKEYLPPKESTTRVHEELIAPEDQAIIPSTALEHQETTLLIDPEDQARVVVKTPGYQEQTKQTISEDQASTTQTTLED